MAGAATFPSRSIPGRICWRRPSGGSLVEVQSLDASLAEQTWEVGIRAGTNPFFFGYPDPPELELERPRSPPKWRRSRCSGLGYEPII